MSEPRVTITLGRSGQVVNRTRDKSDGDTSNSLRLSGTKRLREDVTTSRRVYNGELDERIGRNDLRLKLMHKRMSKRTEQDFEDHKKMRMAKRTEQDFEDRKKMDLREKMSRTIRSSEGSESNDLMLMQSARRSYSSPTFTRLIPKSVHTAPQASMTMSPPRNIDQVRRVQSIRTSDASRTDDFSRSTVLDTTRTKAPTPITMRPSLDAGRRASEFSTASGSLQNGSYLGEQPLTVSGLLHSLGLGKYAIHFQAEEVDMAVLKQMGDRDLKEMGLPMGPRKKILLAMLSLSKRQLL